MRDLLHGFRLLRKSPGFAALAIFTLALGIGAATSVFSLVNAVLLRALPYPHADRLVFLFEPTPRIPDVPLEGWGVFNGDFSDWKQQSSSFETLALYTAESMNLAVDGSAVRIGASRVTGDFFATLGISPQMGRAILPEDDQPGREQVAVISQSLWRSRFGSNRAVVGMQLQLNAKPYRIAGVMPAGFAFPHGGENLETHGKGTDVWISWPMTPQERASRDDDPGYAIGRLREGVTAARAQAELTSIVAPVDKLHPAFLQGCVAVARPFDLEITGTSRRTLLLLLAAVFLVLLIACSNVASLVLARAQGRAMEVGVRTALGASRWRLIRQLLAEQLCLGVAGGVFGMLAAFGAIRLLVLINPGNVSRMEETSVDGTVLLFAVGVSLATTLLFGLFPALTTSQCHVNEVLKGAGTRTVKRGAGRFQKALTVAQVALTFILLAGSGLLIRSFMNVQALDKGFAAPSTLTMSIRLDQRYRRVEQWNGFFHSVVERTGSIPGVQSAAAVTQVPLGGGQSLSIAQIEGRPADDKTVVEGRSVSPRYFDTMGIPLIEGRAFSDSDAAGHPAVAIVSRGFVRKYFPGESGLGRRIRLNGWMTIVGVVADVRQYNLEAPPPSQVYTPLWQGGSRSADLLVRTQLPPGQIASQIRSVVRELDPAVAVADVQSMNQLLSRATADRRFQTLILTAFGGVALFLSLVGLYGLMACLVEQRTAEVGIRMALGAQPGSVLRLILKQGSQLAIGGILFGIAGAWVATRYLASLLFEVEPTDLPTFLLAALIFASVALAACYFPARRATRVDPIQALRSE